MFSLLSDRVVQKRRAIMVDLAICVGIPVLLMILRASISNLTSDDPLTFVAEYIPQGHRFDVWEEIGCYPENYNTWVNLLLMELPPVLIGCVSAVYSSTSFSSTSVLRG